MRQATARSVSRFGAHGSFGIGSVLGFGIGSFSRLGGNTLDHLGAELLQTEQEGIFC